MTQLPTAAQVLELPAEVTRVVPPEFEDSNGHMNIKHYFELQSRAVAGLFERIGYVLGHAGRRVGPFTLEQHLRYHREVVVGAEVSAHLRLVNRSEKLLQGMAFLVDRTEDRVANTFEFMVGNVDLETRRLTPFTASAADAVDRELEVSRGLAWEVPRFPALGLREGVAR
jgi:acyl-CoA thioester hydrolase